MDRTDESSGNVAHRGSVDPPSRDGRADDRFTEPLSPHETIDVVGRRFGFLRALADGPTHKPALQTELSVSRSTVYKAIRELESRRLVERGDDGYRLSHIGRLLLDEYNRFRENVRTICAKGPLLAELGARGEISLAVLEGAEVVYAERHAPHQPIRETTAILESATAVTGMSSVVLPGYVDAFAERLCDGTLEVEFLFSRPTLEWLLEHEREDFLCALETTPLVASVTEEWLPFGLLYATEPTPQVCLSVYDEAGDLRGLLRNDTDAALAWAQRVWQKYEERATDVDPEDLRNDR